MVQTISEFKNKLKDINVTDIIVDRSKGSKSSILDKFLENARTYRQEVRDPFEGLIEGCDYILQPSNKLPSNLEEYYTQFKDPLAKKVIAENIKDIFLIISYPLTNTAIVQLKMGGVQGVSVTPAMMLYLYTAAYQLVYKIEDEDAGGKTGNIGNMLNRATSSGRFGIWGHHISDLVYNGLGNLKFFHEALVCSLDCDS